MIELDYIQTDLDYGQKKNVMNSRYRVPYLLYWGFIKAVDGKKFGVFIDKTQELKTNMAIENACGIQTVMRLYRND